MSFMLVKNSIFKFVVLSVIVLPTLLRFNFAKILLGFKEVIKKVLSLVHGRSEYKMKNLAAIQQL